MKKIFPMIVFSCMTAVVLLICIYRSLPREDVAEKAPEVADAAMAVDATPETDTTVEIDAMSETEAVQGKEVAGETEATQDETRRVALTFDDGPHPVYTVKLLDGLAERGVQATFFVIGENIPGNEEIIARMDQEGHLIGNHTYDHVKITDLSVEDACEQVEKTSALVKEITGKDTEYVRPPFGSWRKDLECSFEMIPVLWDVDPLDWTTCNVSDVVRRVLEAVEPDDIILLHDYYESSVDAALLIVDALTEQGYVFVTVDELILE
ncbi:MAG: polysaccharide deacetylase family protein [Lachnospiraceae bacterium]|nr:polysaccharide deacetylase family protein [Lachnospiraceae bacterium]